MKWHLAWFGFAHHRFGIWHLGSRSAILFAVAGTALVLSAPQAAQAAACSNAPAKFPTSCEASCSPPSSLAANYVGINSGFGSASCGSNQCCLVLGDEACAAEANETGYVTGACKTTCATGKFEFPSTKPVSTCPSGKTCCFSQTPPEAKGAAPSTPTKPKAQPGAPVTLPDPLSGLNFPKLLGNIIRTFSGIAGAIALLMFVYGGVMWILSGGSQDKVKAAQKILINASIGLVLIFGAYTFVSSIVNLIIAPPPGTVGGGEGGETGP